MARRSRVYVVWCDGKRTRAKQERKPSKYTERMIHVRATSIKNAIRKSGVRCVVRKAR